MFPSITRFSNLYEAFIKARAGKRHKPDVAAFECHLERELLQLRRELEAHAYRPLYMSELDPYRMTKDFGNTQD